MFPWREWSCLEMLGRAAESFWRQDEVSDWMLLRSPSVASNSLRPHGLQYVRPPCPSPIPRVYSNSCPLSRWCHPTIVSSVVPFSSCLQSFPASGSLPMSQFFPSGGQSIRVSAPVLPVNIQWLDRGKKKHCAAEESDYPEGRGQGRGGVRDGLASKLSFGLQVGVEWDCEVRKPNSKDSE